MSAASGSPVFEVSAGSASDVGCQRRENQDAILVRRPFFLVADGMGGHAHGREAARIVVEAFDSTVEGSEGWANPAMVEHALVMADAGVASLPFEGRRPGSTVTGVGLTVHAGVPSWLVLNVGDSRTYLWRDGLLDQITVDHSRRQELADAGWSEERAARTTGPNVITRAVGGGSRRAPDADLWLLPARTGDRVLICSDGLSGEVSDQLLSATLLAHADPVAAAEALIGTALKAGGRDNVSVIVLVADLVEGDEEVETGPDTLDSIDLAAPEFQGQTIGSDAARGGTA